MASARFSTSFVYTLPAEVQGEIVTALVAAGVEGAALGDALASRLCDLADTIDVQSIINDVRIMGNCGVVLAGSAPSDTSYIIVDGAAWFVVDDGLFGSPRFFYCGKDEACKGCKVWRFVSCSL